MQKPPTLRGGSTALLGSVVNKRDALPRERTNSEAGSETTAAAGANQKRSLYTLRMRNVTKRDHVQTVLGTPFSATARFSGAAVTVTTAA